MHELRHLVSVYLNIDAEVFVCVRESERNYVCVLWRIEMNELRHLVGVRLNIDAEICVCVRVCVYVRYRAS